MKSALLVLSLLAAVNVSAENEVFARFKSNGTATFVRAVGGDLRLHDRPGGRHSVELKNDGTLLRVWVETLDDSVVVNLNGVALTADRVATIDSVDSAHLFEGAVTAEERESIMAAQPGAAEIAAAKFPREDTTIETAFEQQEDGSYHSTSPMPEWMGGNAYLRMVPEDISPELHVVNGDRGKIDGNRTLRINGIWLTVTDYGSRSGTTQYVLLLPDEYAAIRGYDGFPMVDEPAPPRDGNKLYRMYKDMGYSYRRYREWRNDAEWSIHARLSLTSVLAQHATNQHLVDNCDEEEQVLAEGGTPNRLAGGMSPEARQRDCDRKRQRLESSNASVEGITERLDQALARLELWEAGTPPPRRR